MTTTADAVSRFAHEMGIAEGWVLQIAKALRGASLWPTGRRGGGRVAAHVEVKHLRNLLLACMATELVHEAPARASEYGVLIGRDPSGSKLRDQPRLEAIPFPRFRFKLRDAIDALIEAHLDPEKHPRLLELGLRFEVWRTHPSVRIIADALPGPDNIVTVFPGGLLAGTAGTRSPLLVRSEIRESICAAAAEMVSDTRWRKMAPHRSAHAKT